MLVGREIRAGKGRVHRKRARGAGRSGWDGFRFFDVRNVVGSVVFAIHYARVCV